MYAEDSVGVETDLQVATTHRLPSSTYTHCHICTWFIHLGLFGGI